MFGIPKQFNTLRDIETCVSLAKSGEIDSDQLRDALTVLLGDEFVPTIKLANVPADYVAVEGETIVESLCPETNSVVRNVMVQWENMDSRLRLVLGMTPDQIRSIIGGL